MPKINELGKLQGITISFTEDQYADLTRVAKEKDRAIAYLVREAVSDYLDAYHTNPSAAQIVDALKAQPAAAVA